MQAAAGGEVSNPSSDRNDGHHSIVSDLVSLIGHVQAGIKLLEAAIAREAASCKEEAAGVFVLDDVTPHYVKANAALNACNAALGVALHHLLDTRTTSPEASGLTASDRRPVRLIRLA